jgi:hypothetical protein
MTKYPKINSIYQRDEKTSRFINQYSCDEFAYLSKNEWIGEEKIDGMNVVIWADHPNKTIMIMGRNLQPTVPKQLTDRINNVITYEILIEHFQEMPAIIYGEGCGYKIQAGGHKYVSGSTLQDLIIFDIRVGHTWLKRLDVVSIANELGFRASSEIFKGTLEEASKAAKEGIKSSYGDDFMAEGLVLRPAVSMLDRRANRIITKVKTEDFNVLEK